MCGKVNYIRRFHKFQKSDYWVCHGGPLAPTRQMKRKLIFQNFTKIVQKFMFD